MPTAVDEKKVLAYHDVLLRRGDVALLEHPHEWLNDQILHFQFSFLDSEEHSVLSLSPAVAFIDPATSYLVSLCGESAATELLGPLQVSTKRIVFFAVNNNTRPTIAEGGSHWSLLVFDRASHTWRHFDSMSSANTTAARGLAAAAAPAVAPGPGPPPQFVESSAAPQQQNGSDCGLYVCAVAGAVCKLVSRAAAGPGGELPSVESVEGALCELVTPAGVCRLRGDMLDIIRRKAAEQQQQQQQQQGAAARHGDQGD